MDKGRLLIMSAFLGMAVYLYVLIANGSVYTPLTRNMEQAAAEENRAVQVGRSVENEDQGKHDGTVTMAGSTSMEKLADAMAESFMGEHPKINVTVEFTGSSAGIEALFTGRVEIGNSSRNLTKREQNQGAVENIVAVDVIAVVTGHGNQVTALTKEELIGIYTGKIRNWSAVGGADEAIVVVGREAGSGTRRAFEEILGIEGECIYANELDSTGGVVAKAVTIPGIIGYVSRDVAGDGVRVLSIDGAEPTEENVREGRYLLCRPFVMATKGEICEQSRAVREFFAYLKSEKGREVIRLVGLIAPN